MSLFEIVLGFVLTTMIGFVLVFPIYLVEKYIVLSILDEYIDNVILKAIAVVAVNVLFFLVGFAIIFSVYGYKC
jgi:hypothetical protein|nr:MAG TPA: hypothetical protein [Caudoviricetes sp.]DAI74846.1 MAG TPA: hypothetical protein [Caudoviricetes sp.]DAT48501.1 MAG TPA: hypothetical protein [Caudoviricetes sp.]DAZ06000.1 MAG TPA: hypothetical protein [Caudoviricetes sp.]DAZ12518.1 MAG TPA: hypothetical protein [Caudoviricetes sp.]